MTREEAVVGLRVVAKDPPLIGVVEGHLLHASAHGTVTSLKPPTESDMDCSGRGLSQETAARYVWVKFDRAAHNKLARLDELRPL